MIGERIWKIPEFFLHRAPSLRDEVDTTLDVIKLSLEEFLAHYRKKDKLNPAQKLYRLTGMEEALGILFLGTELGEEAVFENWVAEPTEEANKDEPYKKEKNKEKKQKEGKTGEDSEAEDSGSDLSVGGDMSEAPKSVLPQDLILQQWMNLKCEKKN